MAGSSRPGSGILADLGPHLLDYALTLFGTPERVTADVRIEREGFVTDDAFDIWLHYPGPLVASTERFDAQCSAPCAL